MHGKGEDEGTLWLRTNVGLNLATVTRETGSAHPVMQEGVEMEWWEEMDCWVHVTWH